MKAHMVKEYLKRTNKSPYKNKILQFMADLDANNINGYDLKPLTGREGFYRVRIGTVRIIIERIDTYWKMHKMDNR